jgi:hypothetical protein
MARGAKYDWDEHNEGHVARHNVRPGEVEQALENAPLLIETEIEVTGEERIREVGVTDTGRVLIVVWTPRKGKRRPVTAFDANRKTHALYRAFLEGEKR